MSKVLSVLTAIIILLVTYKAQAQTADSKINPKWPLWYRGYIFFRETKFDLLETSELSLEDTVRLIQKKLTANTGRSISVSIINASASATNNIPQKITTTFKQISVADCLDQVARKFGRRVVFSSSFVTIVPVPNTPEKILRGEFAVTTPISPLLYDNAPELVDLGPMVQIAFDAKTKRLYYQSNVEGVRSAQSIMTATGVINPQEFSKYDFSSLDCFGNRSD